MNKDIVLEKIKYLSTMPHSLLVEYCIYLENEIDNYKSQKYITDLISENGIICDKNKEINNLQQKIHKATELINNGIDFKSLYFNKGKDEEMWKIILVDNIKEELLKILGDI